MVVTKGCVNARKDETGTGYLHYAYNKNVIKAIIFDFYDVFRTDNYKAWLKANALPHEGEWFRACHQQDIGEITNEQFFDRLSELTGRSVTREELSANSTIDSAVIELAETLKQHYKTALLSNAPSVRIRAILAEHNLERLFDEIVVSSEVGLVKPSEEIFHLTLARLGVEAREAIFVDDNVKHTQAAQKLGIQSIQFLSAQQLKQDLAALLGFTGHNIDN